jgi:hypothetical protein
LFDQLQGIGGGFGPPVSLEEIQDAQSAEERLLIYKKIEYLEDLLLDWNEISPLMKQDLVASSTDHVMEIIKLHRKWFDQGRSSSEYTSLLYSLCQNLIETLVTEVIRSENKPIGETDQSKRTLLIALVQNWRDTWLDLMIRDQYSEALAQEMEVCMLILFLRDAPTEVCGFIQEILALLDPCARWFHSWTDHVGSNQHLISLMRDQTIILPDLRISIERCRDSGGVSSLARFLHSLSVFAITIGRTRVSQFPWNDFNVSSKQELKVKELINWKDLLNAPSSIQNDVSMDDSPGNIDSSSIDQMLDIFITTAESLPRNPSSTELKHVFFNGIEVMLAGCKAGGFDFRRRCSKVTSALRNMAASGDTAAKYFQDSPTLREA